MGGFICWDGDGTGGERGGHISGGRWEDLDIGMETGRGGGICLAADGRIYILGWRRDGRKGGGAYIRRQMGGFIYWDGDGTGGAYIRRQTGGFICWDGDGRREGGGHISGGRWEWVNGWMETGDNRTKTLKGFG